ncbi:MAG TPA: hypothetical protein VEB61_00380 [Candidatus Binatia bacterium]|nr:hypothetical protein [Candidatus Binatia bacterium]
MISKQSLGGHRQLRCSLLALFLVWAIILWPITVTAQTLRSHEEAARVVTVGEYKVVDGVVSGEVWNRSPHLLRDVQLLIRYTWLWDDERHPGKTDPGTSTYYTLPKEIGSGARLPFTFSPTPPLPKIGAGRFQTTVSVAGYTEVIPQTK